jgi:hypothetical protein
MIVIEFGGNTLRANTLQQPEKLANCSSENSSSLQAETTDLLAPVVQSQIVLTHDLPGHHSRYKSSVPLRTWIEEHVLKPLGF